MKINTKVFGEIEIEKEKVICFEKGIIGFPQLVRFTLLHDEEKGSSAGIRWLQSLDEPGFAMPTMDPLLVAEDYNPEVEEDMLKGLGLLEPDNLLVLVTATIPSDLTKMSVNLRAPIIINAEERKACQIILEADKYPVKYPIYDIIQSRKAGE